VLGKKQLVRQAVDLGCLEDETLLRFARGRVADEHRAQIEEHLDGCDECRTVVAEALRSMTVSATVGAPSVLAKGMRLARYDILDVVGVGALGVVYRAYDPELQRQVALKTVRPGTPSSRGTEAAQERLLQEARTMARLSHPNVVNVYDAGIHDGHVFLVMEIVEGMTLTAWLCEQSSWQDMLDAFLEAGRGLAAAHAANFVHGDFKPDNVLVAANGRVRVTDFGLAKTVDTNAVFEVRDEISTSSSPATTAGFAGTPFYMAPEQFLGRPIDARTDQFSFCVALYAALYAQHPFGNEIENGESLRTMARKVVDGRIRPPPPQSAVPAGLHAALIRGLSVAPEQRHASMDRLLAELSRARAPRAASRRVPANVAIALIITVGVSASVWALKQGWSLSADGTGHCGDGIVQVGEQCDDGNAFEHDGCLTSCHRAICGDGHIRRHVEECDDGNTRDGDGCSARCLVCSAGRAAFTWAENGHCYMRHDAPVAWTEARRVCGRHSADLLTYGGDREVVAVHGRILDRSTEPVWIGLLDGRRLGSFEWITGEPLAVAANDWEGAPWASSEPRPSKGDCAFQYAGGHETRTKPAVLWRTADCGQAYGFVCEQEGWVVRSEDSHAYLVVSQSASWDEARTACTRWGGHLATLGSDREQDFVAARGHWPLEIWIGATDSDHEGSFRWITEEPFAFSAFAPGEPDNDHGTSNCLILGPRRGWHDRPCGRKYAYVCEIES